MNRTYLFLFFLIFLLFSACQKEPKNTENSTDDVSQATFTANPQPVPEQNVPTLPVGSKAPDFNLPGTDGKFHKLGDYDDSDVLAIIFTCNHCPTAQAYEDRIISIVNDYKDESFTLIEISPNSPISLLFEELGYTELGDTYEEMQIRVKDKGYNFDYLYDGDDHAVSMKYGPVATPHAYVFDKDRILRYVGRLDNSEKPGSANAEDLRNAIDAVIAGEEVELPETKTFGCSVKWAWKDEYKDKVNNDWANAEVTLENIDEAGIAALLKNEDSDKLRLINVWATWCGPCVLEYPEFIEIHRMYMGRDFEFVSISADREEHKNKALEFLQKSESPVKNYIFTNEDRSALTNAFAEFKGALPFTILVEPGGKVVTAINGTIDPLELKKTIVEHPMIGRYY